MQRLKSQTGMQYPPTPSPLMKKSSKLPRMEGQTAPPPRVDPDEESKDRDQKVPSPIQTTPSSVATNINTQKIKGTSEETPTWPLHRNQI